jgi:hypothetical protein
MLNWHCCGCATCHPKELLRRQKKKADSINPEEEQEFRVPPPPQNTVQQPVTAISAVAPPATEQKPVQVPQKAPASAEGPKKISIKDVMAGSRPAENAVSEPVPEKIAPISDREFTAGELREAWIAFAEEIKEESPRISVTLSSVFPELLEDKTIFAQA